MLALPKINRRGWLALWLQERRRVRQQALTAGPNAPVITDAGVDWGTTQEGYADVWIVWAFVHGTYPIAQMEVWVREDAGGYFLLDTVASNMNGYTFAQATNVEVSFTFKVRYQHGATLGPFSNEMHVTTTL